MNAQKHECPKCNGTGTIQAYKHINNGWCYGCGGTGLVDVKKEQVLTQERVKNQKTVTINNEVCGVYPFGDMLRIAGEVGMVLIDWSLAKEGKISIVTIGNEWKGQEQSIKLQLQGQVKRK
jgi:DnaJ-class molecular chaperone